MSGDASEYQTVRRQALALLARREYSLQELTTRLLRKGHGAEVVEQVLTALEQGRLLSDERFAEAYVTGRRNKGFGPQRIAQELRERGVAPDLIADYVDESDRCWLQQAVSVRRKRFGAAVPGDYQGRVKQARFLQYRGFSVEQIRAALGGDEDDF